MVTLVGAAAVVALVAADAQPVLRGAPLVILTVSAAIQICRELAVGLAPRKIYVSTPVTNFVAAIVVTLVLYFARWAKWSVFLELLDVVLLSLFTLVFAAALTTDAKVHGWRQGLRDLGLSLLLPTVIGAAFGCAGLVQAGGAGAPSAAGSFRLALVVAAAWTGSGLAARLERGGSGTSVAALVQVAAAAGVTLAGGVGARLLTPGPALALGVAVGLAAWVGRRAFGALQRWCGAERLWCDLPYHLRWLQPLYERLFRGGAVDYTGMLVPVLPVAWLVCRCCVR